MQILIRGMGWPTKIPPALPAAADYNRAALYIKLEAACRGKGFSLDSPLFCIEYYDTLQIVPPSVSNYRD